MCTFNTYLTRQQNSIIMGVLLLYQTFWCWLIGLSTMGHPSITISMCRILSRVYIYYRYRYIMPEIADYRLTIFGTSVSVNRTKNTFRFRKTILPINSQLYSRRSFPLCRGALHSKTCRPCLRNKNLFLHRTWLFTDLQYIFMCVPMDPTQL